MAHFWRSCIKRSFLLKSKFFLSVIYIYFLSSCADNEILEGTVRRIEAPVTTEVSAKSVEFGFNGWVQIGSQMLEMDFTCYKPGIEDVAAIGIGKHPISGEKTEALVQGFLGKPYVGVTIGKENFYEAALDGILEISIDNNQISADIVRWEKSLDLQSGYGKPGGFGAVFVECGGYESNFPKEGNLN